MQSPVEPPCASDLDHSPQGKLGKVGGDEGALVPRGSAPAVQVVDLSRMPMVPADLSCLRSLLEESGLPELDEPRSAMGGTPPLGVTDLDRIRDGELALARTRGESQCVNGIWFSVSERFFLEKSDFL